MNPVVHFEMPYDDAARMARFYESAFGWKTQALGAEMGHYVLATTSAEPRRAGPSEPGAINGGLFLRPKEAPHPALYVSVDSIDAALSKVGAAGGKVVTPM